MPTHVQTIRRILIIVVSLLLPLRLAWSADTLEDPRPGSEYGAKYFRNYSRKNYNSQPQNWFIIQDQRGMIYFANQGGVLEYDGVCWKEILITGKNARSLAVDHKGTIYIGGNNEIGYLQPDDSDVLHYVSLTHLLENKYRDFGYVWRAYSTADGVYFCTSKYLFLFNPGSIKVWQADTSFSPPYLYGNKLLVRQQSRGLMEMLDGRLSLLPGGETFAADSIYAVVEFSPGILLIGAAAKGFYLYKNGSLTPFKTAALDALSANQPTYGLRLGDGNFAFAARKGGVFIIDNHGRLRLRFDASLGLPDNTVWHIYEDSGHNLWLALNNGISKLEYRSPFSIYDQRHGLKGIVLAAARFGSGSRLYAGTADGLFFMNEKGIFIPVPGIPGSCHALLSYSDSLLAASGKGISQVTEKNDSHRLICDIPAYVFQLTGRERFPILAGTDRGLISLSLDSRSDRWSAVKFIEEIDEEIRTIALDAQENLWLGSPKKGVIKISFPTGPGARTAPVIRRYHPSSFPAGVETHVFHAAAHIIIATGKGIFHWEEKTAGFVPDFTLGNEFAGGENGKSVFRIVEDANKNIWFHSNGRNLAAIPQPDGAYRIYDTEFLRIPFNHVDSIYPDPLEPAVWFAGVDALIRFDVQTGLTRRTPAPFRTLIRGVWANETLIYGGAADHHPEPDNERLPKLPYSRRSLRFSFAAPFYEDEENTRYRCRLDGYDREWTTWSGETRKDYTNLDPGLNVFRVCAMNIYGRIGEEAVFRFKLLPPWYRTWWAFLLYILAAALLVALIVKWRSSKLMQEKQRLEAVIAERTREINRKNEQLQEMARIKSNFFANISHEFRTPLTLILGPLEQMIDAAADPKQQTKLKIMRRNAQRLLRLINQLLELSKFDSGTVVLKAHPGDIVSFLKGLTASFELITARSGQELTFHSTREEIIVYFDATRMEEILCNLLINAVKFTPEGGAISVSIDRQDRSSPGFPGGYVEIAVSDTGPGIPPDRMARLFDRFYYSENIYEYEQKGAGIGLSIASELVGLHHGTIAAENREGEHSGSRFTVRIPLGKDHLQPHEIAAPGAAPDKADSSYKTPPALLLEEEIDAHDDDDTDAVSRLAAAEKEIILVVEDSADVRSYIRGAVEPRYRMIQAQDGEKGKKKALEVIPDLIISDIMMPGVDGYELCRILKKDVKTSHIPIILLTARAGEKNIIQGYETGADDYITKPFNTRVLLARIQNLIDIRSQLQENLKREMTLQPVKTSVSQVDKAFLDELRKILEDNISDPDFNVEGLCKKLYIGHTTLYRKIYALSGETPTDFLRSYRLMKGAELLKTDPGSVLEVAQEVGFSSANYFTRCFKKKFQQLPTDYQASESS